MARLGRHCSDTDVWVGEQDTDKGVAKHMRVDFADARFLGHAVNNFAIVVGADGPAKISNNDKIFPAQLLQGFPVRFPLSVHAGLPSTAHTLLLCKPWLGQKLGNLLPALFISAVSYCLPALLSLSGMKNGIEWLGFYPLFHAAALWQNQGYTADGESYNAMWIPIFLVCAAFFLAWAIGQALIDDYDMIGVPDEVL